MRISKKRNVVPRQKDHTYKNNKIVSKNSSYLGIKINDILIFLPHNDGAISAQNINILVFLGSLKTYDWYVKK